MVDVKVGLTMSDDDNTVVVEPAVEVDMPVDVLTVTEVEVEVSVGTTVVEDSVVNEVLVSVVTVVWAATAAAKTERRRLEYCILTKSFGFYGQLRLCWARRVRIAFVIFLYP